MIYLADTSAWHRAPLISDEWSKRLADRSLATCAQVRLEVLYSARSVDAYARTANRLMALLQLPCGQTELERALAAQRMLADQGGLHHRSVKIPDLIIAASAESADAVVWHYDEDFDRIAAVTGQRTEWVAPRGSL